MEGFLSTPPGRKSKPNPGKLVFEHGLTSPCLRSFLGYVIYRSATTPAAWQAAIYTPTLTGSTVIATALDTGVWLVSAMLSIWISGLASGK